MTGTGNTYACVHGVNMVYDTAWDFFLNIFSGVVLDFERARMEMGFENDIHQAGCFVANYN